MLVNPISFRLSVSFFWNSTWSLYKNNNYKYLFSSDLVFFEFFMFFFRKTLDFRTLDYYPSHIRLYRLYDKIIINLYYHMSKEERYFDEIDLLYKGYRKKVFLKKTKLKKRLLFKQCNIKNYIVLNNFYSIKKIINFINKNLIKIIYFNFLSSLNNVYSDLEWNLNLKWKSLENYIKLNFIKSNVVNWDVIKVFIKDYYLKLGKKYIYFFINNFKLIKDLKKNKIKKFQNLGKVKFSSFNWKKKTKLFSKLRLYYKINNNSKNLLFSKDYVKILMKFFWKKKLSNKIPLCLKKKKNILSKV